MSSLVISPVGASPLRQVRRAPKETNAHRWLLVAITGLIAAAAFPSLRIDLGGLQVPLHVIPVLFALPSTFARLNRIPSRVRATLAAFTFLFGASVLVHGEQFGDFVKVATSAVTLVTVVGLVRSKKDFLIGVLAFGVSLMVMNLRGITGGMVEHVGYEPLRGIANKNAYSIYALPGVMLAAFVLLHFRQRRWATATLVASILTSTFVLFTGANRSGWGGILVIGAMLAIQARRWRALTLVGGLAAASYVVFSVFGDSETFRYQAQRTTSGYGSDTLRQSLFLTAIEIGIENPFFGIGVQELPRELAKRTEADSDVVDPHNVVGYVAGGTGLITLFALIALGIALCLRPTQQMLPKLLLAHDLVRLLVVLFVLRGQFSRELLTVAAFPIATGLALGLSLLDNDETWDLLTVKSAPRKSLKPRP